MPSGATRDWKSYVRERLRLPRLEREREAEIIEDVAQQLEECYREALRHGANEQQAQGQAEGHISDWAEFAREVMRGEERSTRAADERLRERVEDSAARKAGAAILMSNLISDLLYGMRVLRKSPAFTLIAVMTLALGIGANTAIFSVVNGVLLRPLPYPEPDRLMRLSEVSVKRSLMNVTEANFLDWQSGAGGLQGMAMYSSGTVGVMAAGNPARIRAAAVSRGFFDVMGVKPYLGRTLGPDDHRPGAEPAAVVSYGLWQRMLGGDRDLASKRLTYENFQLAIVGVMPPGFDFPGGSESWTAREIAGPVNPSRNSHNWNVIARLRDAATREQVNSQLNAITKRLYDQAGPEKMNAVAASVVPLRDSLVGSAREALWILMGAVGVLLLIACGNVVNLLLAQMASRQKELAVRAALGAGRGRLMRQFVTEGVLLCLLGGIIGVLLAGWGVEALLQLGSNLPRAESVHVDAVVLGFSLGISLITGVVLGIFPALRIFGTNLHDTLKESGRAQSGARSHRQTRSALVISQVALTTILLAGASLLGRSFVRLLNVNLGFQTENRLTVDMLVPAPDGAAGRPVLATFHQRLTERLVALPGVIAAGGISSLPLSGGGANGQFLIEGGRNSTGDRSAGVWYPNYRIAGPGYFAAMGIPLLRGRMFDATDGPGTPHVGLISKLVADRVWPAEDPIGRRINYANMDGDQSWITIVGIVGEVHHRGPEGQPNGDVYLHYLQRPRTRSFTNVIHSSVPASSLIPAVRDAIRDINPEVAVQFRTLDEWFAVNTATRRFNLVLLGVFAATALLLAVMGIYGVISYGVAQRTQEIGIRMALGAQARDVVKIFVGETGRLVMVGLVIGVAGALSLGSVLATLLFELSPRDPATIAAVAAALAIVALAAGYAPARRATRVDPLVALRHE